MTFKQKDFVEIEFTGKVKDGEIFDSNIKSDLDKIKSDQKAKPFTFCLGQGMFLKAIEEFLVGKKVGEYELELEPEKAFGKRDSKLIQLVPMKIFIENKLNPVAGTMFNFDGRIAKIISVSGGRVMVDFNNPIAGKVVEYKIKALRKVEDKNEQIKAFIEFLFRKDLEFEVKDKKIIIKTDQQMAKFVELFAEKFKDVFDMKLEVKEIPSPNNTSKSQ